jgi:hypothetical protein
MIAPSSRLRVVTAERPPPMDITLQVVWLFVLAAPVACVSWTITQEEVSREVRDWCARRTRTCRKLYQRKFFYLFTCEYCLSHYVAAFFLVLTGFRLLLDDWRGVLVAWFALVWVANLYMSLFGRLRLDIKRERVEIAAEEQAAAPEPSASASARRT